MSSGYEWTKRMLTTYPCMTGSRLGELATKAKVKIYPSLVAKVKQELGIKTTRGRPKKIAVGAPEIVKGPKPESDNKILVSSARGSYAELVRQGIEARMAKCVPARTNASFDDAIAVMQIAKQLGGYGVLYDIVDKLKKAGFE